MKSSTPVRLALWADEIADEINLTSRAHDIWEAQIPGDIHSRFEAIKRFYALVGDRRYEAYPFGISIPMSPIEEIVWGDMRSLGLNFYPQYPIGPYFADFADPIKKFVVECDGKDWHNPEADSVRDWRMQQMGWKVYRIPGHQCALPHEDKFSAYHMLEHWFMGS